MKTQREFAGVEHFIARLREDARFRKSVCGASSQAELKTLIDGNGFRLHECQLIQAVADLIEKESEESPGWSYGITDRCLLELL